MWQLILTVWTWDFNKLQFMILPRTLQAFSFHLSHGLIFFFLCIVGLKLLPRIRDDTTVCTFKSLWFQMWEGTLESLTTKKYQWVHKNMKVFNTCNLPISLVASLMLKERKCNEYIISFLILCPYINEILLSSRFLHLKAK